jgi:hypothetical protein
MGRDEERRSGRGYFLAVFAAILAVGLPLIVNYADVQNPRLQISIQAPPAPVRGRLHTIKGTASWPSNQALRLWIVVEGTTGGGRGGYWPQGEVRWNPSQRNAWSCAIALGSPDEREVGRYRIWAVLAEPKAHGVFAEFVETKLTKGSDTPMRNWPTKIARKKSIEVNRLKMIQPKYTSRGVKVSDNDRRRPAWCKKLSPPKARP